MIRIVADTHIPFLRGALDRVAEMIYLPGEAISRTDLLRADALLVRTRTLCNEELLHGTGVRFIASATSGFDHVDTEYCQRVGIAWTHAPGCNAGAVGQYMASALAYVLQKTGRSFHQSCLGVIGAGQVGSKVASLAGKLGMPVLVNDPPRERREGPEAFTNLEELLGKADVVSMHVPLNLTGPDRSLEMASTDFFNRMKTGAWFINTSRGEVTNEETLLRALRTKQLGGCILDVWQNEPHIRPTLHQAADLATPHIAGYSVEGKANGTMACVQAVSRFFNLGKDDWKPGGLSESNRMQQHVACQDMRPESFFLKLAMGNYPVLEDDKAFRDAPQHFESLRNQYPPRREAQSCGVHLSTCPPAYAAIARAVGFQHITISPS